MKILIANWKLNPQKLAEAKALLAAFGRVRTRNKVIVCPPFPYLGILKTRLALGAQNVSEQESGAHTGEVSAGMLKQFKVKYAIVGHSERRALGETDAQINAKLKIALVNKIMPILCVGFGLTAEMSEEEAMVHLQHQLQANLAGIDPQKIIIAYEPVWAIGSGKPATPEHAERVAMFIRIKFKAGKILYGGSTDAENAAGFLRKEVDGLLVGGSSLKKEQFVKMIQS